jgi:hypothetical protein
MIFSLTNPSDAIILIDSGALGASRVRLSKRAGPVRSVPADPLAAT